MSPRHQFQSGLSAPSLLLIIYGVLNLLLVGMQGGFMVHKGPVPSPTRPGRMESRRVIFVQSRAAGPVEFWHQLDRLWWVTNETEMD